MPPRRSRSRALLARGRGLGAALLAVLVLLGLVVPVAGAAAPPDPAVSVSPGPAGRTPTPSVSFSLASGDTATCAVDGISAPVDCTPGWTTPTLPADGAYTITVAVTRQDAPVVDASGQPVLDANGQPTVEPGGTTSGSAGYVLDSSAPGLTVTPPRAAGPYADSGGWTVALAPEPAGSSPVTTSCVLRPPTGASRTLSCAPGTVQPPLDQDGTWTLDVTATDAAGSTTASASYAADVTGPSVAFTSEPAARSGGPLTSTPQVLVWGISTDGVRVDCSLTATSGGPAGTGSCATTRFEVADLPHGTYRLAVTAFDAVGNTTTTTSAPVEVDRTGPTVTISGPTTGTAEQVSWVLGLGGAATATCTVDGAAVAGCTDGATVTGTRSTDGSTTLVVAAQDDLGNPGGATATYTRDTTPGAPTVTVAPVGPTQDRRPVWSISVDSRATAVSCTLGGPAPVDLGACATPGIPTTYTPAAALADGRWTLTVQSSNTTSTATPSDSASVVIDNAEPAGPAVSVVRGTDTAGADELRWTWTPLAAGPDEAPRRTQCQLTTPTGVEPGFTDCASPYTVSPTTSGTYAMQVRYADTLQAGEPSTPSAFVYDGDAPAAPSAVRTPAGDPVMAGPVSWALAPAPGDTDVDRYECLLTGPGPAAASWSPCSAEYLVTDGAWSFSARAVDTAGNVGAASEPDVFTADGTAPGDPTVDRVQPSPSAGRLEWLVTGGTDAVAVECQLLPTETEYSDCNASYTAGSGSYVLRARSIDAVGNRSAAVDGKEIVVDADGPAEPTITLADDAGREPTAGWVVTAAEEGVLECLLEHRGTPTAPWTASGTWTTCASPAATALPDGPGEHRLLARSYDLLGNRGATRTGPVYLLDQQGPDAPLVEGDLDGTTGTTTQVVYTVTGVPADATGSTCTLQTLVDGVVDASKDAAVTDCRAGVTVPLTASGEYRLHVVLVDEHGNESLPATSGTYVLDITDPLAPTVESLLDGTTGSALEYGYSFTAEEGDATCVLYRGTVEQQRTVKCVSPHPVVLPGTPDDSGLWHLEVFFTDGVGNVGPAGRSGDYELDRRPPEQPVVTVTPTAGATERAAWTVQPVEALATADCRLRYTAPGGPTVVPAAFAPCDPDFAYDLTSGDGEYELEVRLTDRYDNAGTPVVGDAYLLDTTGPDSPTVSGGRAGTTDDELLVTWTVADVPADADDSVCTVQRVADNGTATSVQELGDCRAGASTTLPPENGDYRLQVVLLDVHDNAGPPAFSGLYALDVVDPGRPTVEGDLDRTTANVLVYDYRFSTEEGEATCVLRHDVAVHETTSPCMSPLPVVLPDDPSSSGLWWLEVSYTDLAGNTGLTGRSEDYELDRTPPADPSVTVRPRTDDVESATWTVTPAETGTTSTCRLRYTDLAGVTTFPADLTACLAPYAFPLTQGDGTYELEVQLTDAVGNPGTAVVGEGYLLDTDAPDAPDVTGPTVEDNVTTVAWTWAPEAGSTSTCRLLHAVGTTTTDVSYPGMPCAPGADVVLSTGSGDYRFEVVVTDAVGNPSPAGTSAAYPLDVTPPDAPAFTVEPTGPSKEQAVSWTFGLEGDGACRVVLRGGTAPAYSWTPVTGLAGPCTGSYAAVLPKTSGAYALEVVDTDAVGNSSAVGRSAAYLLDVTPPTTPAPAGPPATGNLTTVTWSFPGEGTATCELLLDGASQGGPVGCGPSFTTTLTADGPWQLVVVRTDAVLNDSAPGTSAVYLLDTGLPPAPSVSRPSPAGPSQVRTPSWSVSGESGARLECRLEPSTLPGWTACDDGFSADLTGRPDGGYLLQARATDAAGNVSPAGSSPAAYVLDTTPPPAFSVSGPSGPSPVRTPRFTWTGEPGATATCQLALDGQPVGGPVGCATGYTPTLATDGTWTVTVVLTDAALNSGDPQTSGPYLLDATPPPAPGVTPPASPGRDLAPSWGVSAEGGARLECRLIPPGGTAPAWAPCPSPLVTPLTGRPDGRYVLEVRATDAAGNVSGTGSGAYVLDTVPPAAAVISGPAGPARETAPSYAFTTEAGATTRCRTTSGPTVLSDFAPCTSPVRLDLTGQPDGTYTLTVRVLDAAGNPGPAAGATYVLDRTAPAAPVFTTVPASPDSTRRPVWELTAEAGATLRCTLTPPGGTASPLTPCASPLAVDLTGRPDGSYLLAVVAVDRAGNTSPAATSTHVLDSSVVRAPVLTAPPSPGNDRTPTWGVAGGTGTECRLVSGTSVLLDWTACTPSLTADLFGRPDGTYVLSARTRTSAATSAVTTSSYVLDTTAPGAATVVAPFSPSTNRQPTWTVATTEVGATAECRVVLLGTAVQPWAPCAISAAGSPYRLDLTGRGDGTYVLEVRVVDAAGNRGSETASPYVLDTSAPSAVGVVGPPSPGNDLAPVWRITAPAGTLLECRLSAGDTVLDDWSPCTAEYRAVLTGRPDGTYVLAVRAVSAAGTPGPETTSAYELRTIDPDGPVITRSPPPTGSAREVSWDFTLPPGTTGRCTVTQAARTVVDTACTSPFRLDLSSEPDGTYVLSLVAVDAAGNRSSPATGQYVLDTVPTAAPVFTAIPGSPASTLDPTWHFVVARDAVAQCRLLQGGTVLQDWAECTTATSWTARLSGRPDGEYALQVRAVDRAKNTSAPASSSYVLDRTAAPVAVFTAVPPSPAGLAVAEWRYTVPAGTTAECRTTSPRGTATAWAACSGTSRLAFAGTDPDGSWSLEVRLVDGQGTRGAVSRSTHVRDTTAPAAVRFTAQPPAVGALTSVAWSWAASPDDVQCRLVASGSPAPAWEFCDALTRTVVLSTDGSYAFSVRAVDAAGNAGPETTGRYVLDRLAPSPAVFTSRPPASGSDRTVAWTFVVPPGTTATCSVTRGVVPVVAAVPCDGRFAVDLTGQPEGDYVLTVVLADAAGNRTPSSSSYALRNGAPSSAPPPGTGGGTPGTGTGGALPGGSAGGGGGDGGTAAPRTPTLLGPVGGLLPPVVDDVLGAGPAAVGGGGSSSGASGGSPEPAGEPTRPGQGTALGPLPVSDVPEVLRDVVAGTITKPTLPLALLAVVVLFLLAQNRIDRRDPKLAAGDAEPEPELDFTAFVRRPGAAT